MSRGGAIFRSAGAARLILQWFAAAVSVVTIGTLHFCIMNIYRYGHRNYPMVHQDSRKCVWPTVITFSTSMTCSGPASSSRLPPDISEIKSASVVSSNINTNTYFGSKFGIDFKFHRGCSVDDQQPCSITKQNLTNWFCVSFGIWHQERKHIQLLTYTVGHLT
jgi:hypothetical protein